MIANDRRADPNHTFRSSDVHGCCACEKIKANNVMDIEGEILFHHLVLERRQGSIGFGCEKCSQRDMID